MPGVSGLGEQRKVGQEQSGNQLPFAGLQFGGVRLHSPMSDRKQDC
jgi:hypothetical protein